VNKGPGIDPGSLEFINSAGFLVCGVHDYYCLMYSVAYERHNEFKMKSKRITFPSYRILLRVPEMKPQLCWYVSVRESKDSKVLC